MEHDEKPLPIDIRLLGALAEKVIEVHCFDCLTWGLWFACFLKVTLLFSVSSICQGSSLQGNGVRRCNVEKDGCKSCCCCWSTYTYKQSATPTWGLFLTLALLTTCGGMLLTAILFVGCSWYSYLCTATFGCSVEGVLVLCAFQCPIPILLFCLVTSFHGIPGMKNCSDGMMLSRHTLWKQLRQLLHISYWMLP